MVYIKMKYCNENVKVSHLLPSLIIFIIVRSLRQHSCIVALLKKKHIIHMSEEAYLFKTLSSIESTVC